MRIARMVCLLLSLAPGMDISRPTACEATLAAWGF
jgi:hypothetical protein